MKSVLIFCSIAFALVNSTLSYCADEVTRQSNEIKVINTTPAFWQFWEAAQGKSDQERAQLFFKLVVNAYPELYGAGVIGNNALSGKQDDKAENDSVMKYLTNVQSYIPRMKIISNDIARDFDTYAKDFTLTFPKYAPHTNIYFMVSLFGFDGGTRTINNKTALLFGIDGIARYHPEGESLKVFFDHELFHQYHDQIAPDLTDDDAPIWAQLWEEGLATYISQQMNAGSTEAQVLMSPTMSAATKPILQKIAQELVDNADSKDKNEYAAFFYGSNGRADLPPRCGYYVGYQIAQQIGQKYTVQQLAELRGSELRTAVLDVLKQLAAGS